MLEAYTARDTLIVADDFSKIFDKPINISKENKRIDQEFQVMLLWSVSLDFFKCFIIHLSIYKELVVAIS